MFPFDQQDIDHVAREVWLRHARLIGIALQILGLDEIPLPRGPAAKVLRVLEPAKAMAWRLLYLRAPDITLTVSPLRPSPPRCP